jgi:hypothetical protein
MISKRITANVPEYVKSVVEREEKILFANKPDIQIPKNMKYPTSKMTPTSLKAMFYGVLP